MRRWGKGLLALAAMMSISGSAAAQDEAGFQAYLQGVAAKARSQGVSERAISAVLNGLTYNPRVVELDRGQPGGTSNSVPAFAPY